LYLEATIRKSVKLQSTCRGCTIVDRGMTKLAQETGPPAVPTPEGERPLRFVSGLESLDDLVELFTHTVDEKTIFIATKKPLPVGTHRRFMVTLRNGQPVLCGDGEICESPALLAGPGSPTGIRLRMLRLTKESAAIHARILDLRRERAAHQTRKLPLPPVPPPRGKADPARPAAVSPAKATAAEPPAIQVPSIPPRLDRTKAPAADAAGTGPPSAAADDAQGAQAQASDEPTEERVPPSPFVLPANPLSELSDKNLHALIECSIYEDNGMPRFEPAEMVGVAARSGTTVAPPPPTDRQIGQQIGEQIGEQLGQQLADGEARAVAAAAAAAAAAVASIEPPPPAPPAAAPPPTIIEIPGPPVKVSVGIGAMVMTTLLGIALGLVAGYVLFEMDVLGRHADRGAPAAGGAGEPDDPRGDPRPIAIGVDAAPADPAAVDAGAVADPLGDDVADGGGDAAGTDPAGTDDPVASDGPCTATIEASADDARVLRDGVPVGRVPVRGLTLPCGEAVVIRVEHPRYRAFERRITATPGEPVRVSAVLRRPDITLKVVSSPPGAIVTVEGKVIGRAPAAVEVSAFTKVYVTATLDGYKVWTRSVKVTGSDKTVQVRLEGIAGR
jgi:hypothetical protein